MLNDETQLGLIGGPYRHRPLFKGDEVLCAVHGLQVVGGFFGPQQWPRAQVGGWPQLIVCDGLLAALSFEARTAIAFHWGIHLRTVANWRKALGMTHVLSPAVRTFRIANMTKNNMRNPTAFVERGRAFLRSLSSDQRSHLGWAAAGERRWRQDEIDCILKLPVEEAAAILGRSLSSIRSARTRARKRQTTL